MVQKDTAMSLSSLPSERTGEGPAVELCVKEINNSDFAPAAYSPPFPISGSAIRCRGCS